MDIFAYVLALFWGGVWAAFLQFTEIGQFLAIKRTWITVVVGVGVDLMIMLMVIDWQAWLHVFYVIGCSSIFIITRSLILEWQELRSLINVEDIED